MRNYLWLFATLGGLVLALAAYYAAIFGPWIILYLLASQI